MKKKKIGVCRHCMACNLGKGTCSLGYSVTVLDHSVSPKRKNELYNCDPAEKCPGPIHDGSALQIAEAKGWEAIAEKNQKIMESATMTQEQQAVFEELRLALAKCNLAGICLTYTGYCFVGLNGNKVTVDGRGYNLPVVVPFENPCIKKSSGQYIFTSSEHISFPLDVYNMPHIRPIKSTKGYYVVRIRSKEGEKELKFEWLDEVREFLEDNYKGGLDVPIPIIIDALSAKKPITAFQREGELTRAHLSLYAHIPLEEIEYERKEGVKTNVFLFG